MPDRVYFLIITVYSGALDQYGVV